MDGAADMDVIMTGGAMGGGDNLFSFGDGATGFHTGFGGAGAGAGSGAGGAGAGMGLTSPTNYGDLSLTSSGGVTPHDLVAPGEFAGSGQTGLAATLLCEEHVLEHVSHG